MDSINFPQPIRILLVGLSDGFARSASRYIEGDMRMLLTGIAPSLTLNEMLVSFTRPDVILLDWFTLHAAPVELIRTVRQTYPALRLVCLANEGEPYRAAAVSAGADALISTDTFAGELELLLGELFPERFIALQGENE